VLEAVASARRLIRAYVQDLSERLDSEVMVGMETDRHGMNGWAEKNLL
jgi:hypothetical protein